MTTTETTRNLTFRRMPADDAPDIPVTPPPAPRDLSASSFQERSAFLKSVCEAAGLRLPETRVHEGDALIEVGHERVRMYEGEINALPSLADAASALGARESLEQPLSLPVRLSELRMDPQDGSLTRGGGPLAMTGRGLGHLLDFVAPAGVRSPESSLAALSPRVRADAVNEWIGQAVRNGARTDVIKGHRVEKPLVLQTRKPDGRQRMIEAVTSERYAVLPDAALARAVAEAERMGRIPAGGKCRVTIGPTGRVDLEVIWPAMQREIRVGDVLMARARVGHGHGKIAGIEADAGAFRVLCYNCTTAWTEDEHATRTIHVGDPAKILTAVVNDLVAAAKRVEPLVFAFGEAYRIALPKPRTDVVAELVKARKAHGDFTSTLAEQSIALWDMDGEASAGDTLGGLANAITRATQLMPFDQALRGEALAGMLVQRGLVPVMLGA